MYYIEMIDSTKWLVSNSNPHNCQSTALTIRPFELDNNIFQILCHDGFISFTQVSCATVVIKRKIFLPLSTIFKVWFHFIRNYRTRNSLRMSSFEIIPIKMASVCH